MASDVKHEKFLHVLRLLCLQSVTAGGIRAARYDSLRRSVAQAYGFQHLCTMNNLERAGKVCCGIISGNTCSNIFCATYF